MPPKYYIIINMEKDLKNYTLPELQKLIESLGEKKFIARNIFQWIQQKKKESINDFSNVSKEFRQKLINQGFYISKLKILKKLNDPDGSLKYLFGLADDNRIETVLLDDNGRKTLCISSQVGCKYGCLFCATAKLKLLRSLTAAEIVDQIVQVTIDENIVSSQKADADPERGLNIVYMGMGEPFDNYDEVMRSVRIINDPAGLNIGARHITISTCGVVPGIKRLAEENLQVRLAISLHGHTDNIRTPLMPVTKKYPVEELIKAIKEYQEKTDRRVTFEYILLAGINDSREHARGLLKLLTGIKSHMNLIEFNEFSGTKYKAPSRKVIKEFEWIIADRGFPVNVRFKRGREIMAACGQLGAVTPDAPAARDH